MDIQRKPKIKHTQSGNFFLLAGPCAIEGEEMALRIAEKAVEITNKLEIPYIFKGSYRKANRSRIDDGSMKLLLRLSRSTSWKRWPPTYSSK